MRWGKIKLSHRLQLRCAPSLRIEGFRNETNKIRARIGSERKIIFILFECVKCKLKQTYRALDTTS